MIISKHFLFAILLGPLVLTLLLVHAQEQSGFISIDCGTHESSYTDETTGIFYLSDANFTESGENKDISAAYKKQIVDQLQLWNVRSFPQGIRNCYTLKPKVVKGNRYLIRARFLYGNYDNQLQPPEFNLYIGVDLWDTITTNTANDSIDTEIIHVVSSDNIHVCLVNTGLGIPFISALELRPLLNDTIYKTESVGSSISNDVYDRLWTGFRTDVWKALTTSLKDENSITQNIYLLPFTVMNTASTKNNSVSYMSISWKDLNSTSKFYFYFHFTELQKLTKGQFRMFDIFINGHSWFEQLAPGYLKTNTLYSGSGFNIADTNGSIEIWLNKTKNSTLPPLINAMEIFIQKDLSELQETNQKDVDAILNIKSVYEVSIYSWQGDPCLPQAYLWDGLNCSYNGDNPQIISLNLTSSGLKEGIAPYIANLTRLQVLDLSNNSLSGIVPDFLAQLAFLRVLNLKGNNFTGPIPTALLERSNNGLSLSVDANLMGNKTSTSSGKNKFVAPLVASVSGLLLHFII
ncbi:hypothetical protein UlMin_017194 [Ulmus minor]